MNTQQLDVYADTRRHFDDEEEEYCNDCGLPVNQCDCSEDEDDPEEE
jgi:hypothetical protein